MKKILVFAISLTVALFAAACSNAGDTTRNANNSTTTNSATANTTTANTASASHNATASGGDIPAAVRAAITDAQTFSKEHKDIPANIIASIEKETGTKVTDKDHHSYLAFSTTGGARRQVGAATVVNASGQEMVIVYDSKEGSPVIREILGGSFAPDFRDQFKGKGHDDALTLGKDIKATGTPEAMARQVTSAIKADVLAMQALYGAAHSH